MKIHYVIKDYTEDDFSNTFELKWTHTHAGKPCWGAIVTDIAKDHFNNEPRDPRLFELTIGVKTDLKDEPKWFKITAEATVDFYYMEI